MKKRISLLLAAALLAGTLSGCSGTNPIDWVKQKFRDVTGVSEEATADPTETASADNAAPEREIPVALDTEISNELVRYGLAYQAEYGLDPYNCLSLNNRVIFSFLYEPLFAVNSAYEAVPVLAEGYDISDDGLTTTVYLQKDVRFHDGSRLTAKDVLYSIDQARGSDYYGSRFYAVTNASADGDYTVVLTTSTAYECLPLLLDIPIVKEPVVQKPETPSTEEGSDTEKPDGAALPDTTTEEPVEVTPSQPLGTGPYCFVSEHQLERFADWWQDASPIADFSSISLYAATTSADIRDHFEYEDVNLVRTDPNSSAYVNFHNDYELWNDTTTIMQYVGYNLNSNVFSNYGLRSAITYAIDREKIVTEQTGGFAAAAVLPCSPNAPFYDVRLANSFSYSTARFYEQLESASVEDMDGDGVLDLYVTSLGYAVPVSGTMLVCSSSYQRVLAASEIVEALNALGFDLTLKTVDSTEFKQALALGNFDLYYGEVRMSANFDLSPFFRYGGSLSYGSLADSYMENLCKLALANNGNTYNLYERVCGRGYITPVLFKNYALYSTRGSVADPSEYLDWILPKPQQAAPAETPKQ